MERWPFITEASSPGEGLSQTPAGLGGILETGGGGRETEEDSDRQKERESSSNMFLSMSFPDGHIQAVDG